MLIIEAVMKFTFLILIFIISVSSKAQEPVIIMSGDYIPYTSSKNKGSGVVLDIVKQSLYTQGVVVEFRFAPWKRCENMVLNGDVFAALPYFKTDERLQKFDFSDPIVYSRNKFFYLRDNFPNGFSWNNLEDFQGYKIGGILGYWYFNDFEEADLTVEKARTDIQNIRRLLSKRIDFIIIDEITGLYLINRYFKEREEDIGIVEKEESYSPFHALISRIYPGSAELTIKLNKGLEELIKSGEYNKILIKYNLPLNSKVERN